jgi:tRNA 2-thiouridine synthesizing protein A
MMFYPIGNDGQAKRRKAQGIAIGAEKQAFALRLKPLDDAGQNRPAANFAQRLIAPSHSPGQTAGEHHPRYRDSFSHGSRGLGCDGRTRQDSACVISPSWRRCRIMIVTKLDLTGLKCPLPALKTRKALKSLAPGDRLEVRCTDPLAVIDIPHLVGAIGDRLETIERGERETVFRIEKSAPTPTSKPPAC